MCAACRRAPIALRAPISRPPAPMPRWSRICARRGRLCWASCTPRNMRFSKACRPRAIHGIWRARRAVPRRAPVLPLPPAWCRWRLARKPRAASIGPLPILGFALSSLQRLRLVALAWCLWRLLSIRSAPLAQARRTRPFWRRAMRRIICALNSEQDSSTTWRGRLLLRC